jgi:hypothetical protein
VSSLERDLKAEAAILRYDEILDAEPLDREATVALVDEVGGWAEIQLSGAVDEEDAVGGE